MKDNQLKTVVLLIVGILFVYLGLIGFAQGYLESFTASNIIVSVLLIFTGAFLILRQVKKIREPEKSCDSEKLVPRISGDAITSAIVPFILCINALCFIFLIRSLPSTSFYNLLSIICSVLGIILFISMFLSPAFIIVGIWATIKIWKSRGMLKGYIFSLSGIGLSILSSYLMLMGTTSTRPESDIMFCQSDMKELHKAFVDYSKTHDNQYPAIDKWCDVLAEQPNMDKWIFSCQSSNRQPPYKCSYAINPNAEPNSAGDVVLLFETKDGWNQFGGPELMVFDNHYRKGCNVLFNDGHMEFISPKQKDKLKWGTAIP